MHDHVISRRSPRAPARGIVLPVCLSLMFCLFVLALALAEQSRTHLGFALSVEAETRGREAASAALADLTSILQCSVDPTRWTLELPPTYMGLPNPIPPTETGAERPSPSGPTLPLQRNPELPFQNGPDIDVKIDGQFGGRAPDASFHRPPPSACDPTFPDGYASPRMTNGGVPVPSRHTAVYVQATLPGVGLTRWLGMMSSNFPYGLMAPHGRVVIKDAWTSGDYAGTSETGLLANIVAGTAITATGKVNARFVVPPGTSVQAPRGIICATRGVRWPTDFDETVEKTRQKLAGSGLIDKGDDIRTLQQARHESIPDSTTITASCQVGRCVAQFNPGNPDVSTVNGLSGTDLSGGTFRIASADFVIPSGVSVQIPFNLEIQGNLILCDSAELRVSNALHVYGDVRLSPNSTLAVEQKLTVEGYVDMLYAPGANPSIVASLVSGGDMTLARGMSSHEQGIELTPNVTPFSKPDCPFGPSTLTCVVDGRPPQVHTEEAPNPNCKAFDQKATPNVQALNAAWGAFFPGVSVAGQQTTRQVAGVLAVSDGQITVGSSTNDVAAGFFVASGDLNLTLGRLVGVAWSRGGDIHAPSTSWRWYPYFAHAYVYGPRDSTAIIANRYWRVGSGQIR